MVKLTASAFFGRLTENVLQTLRILQRDGLVGRTVHPSVPPAVSYDLTVMGKSLLTPFGALVAWADEHHPAVVTAPRSEGSLRVPPPTAAAVLAPALVVLPTRHAWLVSAPRQARAPASPPLAFSLVLRI